MWITYVHLFIRVVIMSGDQSTAVIEWIDGKINLYALAMWITYVYVFLQ